MIGFFVIKPHLIHIQLNTAVRYYPNLALIIALGNVIVNAGFIVVTKM